MEDSVGPLAMISCEPRQARKGATVAVTSCAGVRLAEDSTFILYCRQPSSKVTLA